MKIKLIKEIYLNKTILQPGTVTEATEDGGYIFLKYRTCCSEGARRLEPEEFEFYDMADNVGT